MRGVAACDPCERSMHGTPIPFLTLELKARDDNVAQQGERGLVPHPGKPVVIDAGRRGRLARLVQESRQKPVFSFLITKMDKDGIHPFVSWLLGPAPH